MPILELPVSLLGRRLRPVALGLTMWCAAVLWSVYADGIAVSEAVVVAVVATALILFCAGWVMRSSKLEQAGLLGVVFAATANAVQVVLTLGVQPRILVSAAIAVIAAGSYFLERLDPLTDGRRAGG